MTDEVEIKFQCSPDITAELLRISKIGPDYLFSPVSTAEIHDTYLDTEDLLLMKNGASLRCRKEGKNLNVTFKSNSRFNASSITRDEIEQAVDEKMFEALLHRGKPPSFVMPIVRRIIGGRSLKQVLEIENRRQIRGIQRTNGVMMAELCLDQVTFRREGRESTLNGIEIEVKGEGTVSDLEALTSHLQSRFPNLRPDFEPKFEKGIMLLQ
jgi:inorganic triphosphatase YgiF